MNKELIEILREIEKSSHALLLCGSFKCYGYDCECCLVADSGWLTNYASDIFSISL